MKPRKVTLDVSSHLTSCIDEGGNRCQHLATSPFGAACFGDVRICTLFSELNPQGRWKALSEEKGCPMRHPLCLAAEEKADV